MLTEKAKELMKKVGIAELEKRDITQVSGRQFQRVGICRALMNNPKVVFGDEPTGALNSKNVMEIMHIMSEINSEGITVILVTHDAKIAAMTERIMFMSDGKMVSEMRLEKLNNTDLDKRIQKVTAKMREIGI